jgi:heat shock protein 4
LIGDPVKFQIRKNLKNTVLFPTRFLGLNAGCEGQLALEKRFCCHKTVELENRKIGFEVVQQGQQLRLTAEQILTFYLKKLKRFYELNEITTNEICLTIPSYCSQIERQAVLDAAEIAGLKCLRVMNESSAIALQYGFFRKEDLDSVKQRIVAFVDLGHSKTTITIAGFVQGKTKIICHRSDRNLGARDFDWEILKLISAEFAKKFGDNPMESPRCVVRMLEAIEKARIMLSSVPDSQLNIDYLLNEEDLVRTLKRDEFEKLINPYIIRFQELIKRTISASGT